MPIDLFTGSEDPETIYSRLNDVISAINTLMAGVNTLIDADEDTSVVVDTGDDDTIRFNTAGVAIAYINTNGGVFGQASNEGFSYTARLVVREVSNAYLNSNVAGSEREIVFNAYNSHFYGCTSSGAAGSALWEQLGA